MHLIVEAPLFGALGTHLDLLSIPQSGGKNAKTLTGGIIDGKDKRVSMVVTSGQQYHIGDFSVAQFIFSKQSQSYAQ